MHSQLLEYFQAGSLLTDSQSGFRPNNSTCTALISAVNLWLTNMDAGKLNGSVFTGVPNGSAPQNIRSSGQEFAG